MAFIVPVLEKLRIREIIDSLCPVRAIAAYSIGEVVETLIMNRLIDPEPFYEVEGWMKRYAVSEYYKKEQKSISDDKIARSLDKLYDSIQNIESKIAINAIEEFNLDITSFHYDITSISFEGMYKKGEEDGYIDIVHGYSRDRRPDLKQATLGIDITHEYGVPLVHKAASGNVADVTTYKENLQRIQRQLHVPSPILIHDRGMVSTQNLLHAAQAGAKFICSYELTDSTKKTLSMRIDEGKVFEPLSYQPVFSKRKDKDQYYGIESQMTISEKDKKTKEKRELSCRLIFIKSDEKLKKDQKRRTKNLEKIIHGLERVKGLLNKYDYKTISYVERKIGELLFRNPCAKYFTIDVTEKQGLISLVYRIKDDFVKEDSFFDGIYALATNLDKEEYDKDMILVKYKGQHRIESRFRNLKSELKVSPVFLHCEKRIESLLFIIFLSLMVYALIEKRIRESGRPEYMRMTTRALFNLFENVVLVYIQFKALLTCQGNPSDTAICREIKQVSNLSMPLAELLRTINFKTPAEYFE
jgi:transposase